MRFSLNLHLPSYLYVPAVSLSFPIIQDVEVSTIGQAFTVPSTSPIVLVVLGAEYLITPTIEDGQLVVGEQFQALYHKEVIQTITIRREAIEYHQFVAQDPNRNRSRIATIHITNRVSEHIRVSPITIARIRGIDDRIRTCRNRIPMYSLTDYRNAFERASDRVIRQNIDNHRCIERRLRNIGVGYR